MDPGDKVAVNPAAHYSKHIRPGPVYPNKNIPEEGKDCQNVVLSREIAYRTLPDEIIRTS